MTRVLAIDAGASTGLAVVDFTDDGPALIHMHQFIDNTVDTMLVIHDTIVDFVPDIVVAEQFDLRPSNKFTADLSTVYRNGALEYILAVDFVMTPVWQTPAQAKRLVSDKVLKRFGRDFWPTGKTVEQKDADDVRDALRHAIYYGATTLEHRPTQERGWPNA